MNPNSPDAVAQRLAFHRNAVALRDRLAREAATNPSPDAIATLQSAETEVRAGLSRMEAMGDPIPGESSPPSSKTGVIDPPATPPPAAVRPAPAAGVPFKPKQEPAVDPVEALARRILDA